MLYTHGIIIGKFFPLHRGHCFLIDVALRNSNTVTLFLCSLPTESIAGAIRVSWMKRLFPALNIVHINTARSEAHRDNPRAVEIWAQTIKAHLSQKADVLFASESYGEVLAQLLGVHFVNVDPRRNIIPVSGHSIRSAPLAHWQYLPEVVRSYFVLPVMVSLDTPAQETKIVQQLATHFATTALYAHVLPYSEDIAEFADAYVCAQMHLAHKCIFIPASMQHTIRMMSYYPTLHITLSGGVHGWRCRWRIALRDAHNEEILGVCRRRQLLPVLVRAVRTYIAAR